MKTKQEIVEEIEQVLLNQELQNIRIMDALENALDYVRSSHDKRMEMDEYFNNPYEMQKNAEGEEQNGI